MKENFRLSILHLKTLPVASPVMNTVVVIWSTFTKQFHRKKLMDNYKKNITP